MIARRLTQLADLTVRRPRAVLAVAGAVLVLALVGLAQLGTSAAVSTMTGGGGEANRADRASAERFGDESIIVLVRGSVRSLMLGDDLQRLLNLEGCLGGRAPRENVPDAELPGGAGGPCAALRDLDPSHVVYGPATFANSLLGALTSGIQQEAAAAIQRLQQVQAQATERATKRGASKAEAERAGRRAADRETRRLQGLLQVARRYGIDFPNMPTLSDRPFVGRLVFGNPSGGSGEPRARFSVVMPSRDAAMIAMRLRADLDDDGRREAARLVREAVALPELALSEGRYVVSGTPVLVGAVADELQDALLLLLAVGVLVMALVLALTFPERRRLLPLLLALATLAVVFGGTGLLGFSVNLGTIATLPVLLGLAVDYGVQLHARVEEARRRGLSEDDAVRDAAARGGPPVLLAATASLAGFLALMTSPTPLVRGFAIVLVVGVAIAVLTALTVGVALGAATRGTTVRDAHAALTDWRTRVGLALVVALAVGVPLLTPAWGWSLVGLAGGVAWLVADRVLARRASTPPRPGGERRRSPFDATVGMAIGHGRIVRNVVAVAHRRGGLVLLLGGALAIGGLVMGNREPVETNLQRLVPSDLPALRDLQAVEAATGLSGELRILVEGPDATKAATIAWMDELRDRVLQVGGYDPRRGCASATICPLSSPADVLEGVPDDDAALDAQLEQLPEYFRTSVIGEDRRSALLTFGMRLGPLQEQRDTVDAVRAAVGDPPDGVRATVTGLPVTVADASVEVSDVGRRVMTLLLSLVLVGIALTALTRSWRRGLVPLVPVAYGTGWAGLLTWALGLPLNPLSVVLGALVVAIGTEFSVLLAERYRQERAAGHGDATAIARTAASTGRAVGASAATAIAGFAVLAVSDIPLLRQFGLVTVLDLVVALVAVVVVLPALAGVAARHRVRVERRRPTPSAVSDPASR